jgi:hypothetical protein
MSRWKLVAYIAIALAVGVRLTGYLARWPLFIDDARLATNIVSRSPVALTRPLAFEQTAPVPLLWSDWALTRLFGPNELALRAVPLIAGILTLVLLWQVGRDMLGPREGILAVLFAAGSPLLIYFGSNSVKQYGVDACVTTALLWLALPVVRDPSDRRGWLALAIGGVVGLWCSQPAVFVLAGIGLAIAVAILEEKDRARVVVPAAGTGAAWAASFAVLYLGWYRPVAHNAYMMRFWADNFLSFRQPHFGLALYHASYYAWALPFTTNLQLSVRVVAAFFAIGLGLIAHGRGIRWACLIGGPYAALSIAVLLGDYPVADRLVLFAVPCLFLGCAAGIVGLIDFLPRLARPVVFAAVAVGLTLHVLISAPAEARSTYGLEDSRTVIASIDKGAPVYVMARGNPAWFFYTLDWHAPDTTRLHWIVNATVAPYGPAFENGPSRGRALHDEGDTLTYVSNGRRVLLGLRSGIEFPRMRGSPRPDSGWASNEARRMCAAATPNVWVFGSHYMYSYPRLEDSELGMLLTAVQRDGGVIDERVIRSDAAAIRIEFSPATKLCGSSSAGSPSG